MSFSDVPPVTPPDSLLRVMRQGCKDARIASNIQLDNSAIDAFLLNVLPVEPTDAQLKSWLASGFRLPLQYPSVHAEVNLISNLCMLNSLSGYRVAFHRALGQGAHNTIVQIVMSLYLDDPAGDSTLPLSAKTLETLTPMILLDRLGLPTHEEKPHPTLPATLIGVARRDDLYEALTILCTAANDTGKRLAQMSCPDLGTFVERTIRQASKQGKTDEERAALIANTLIAALPVFNDAYTFDKDGDQQPSMTVHIHKRALLLISWLHSAFLSSTDDPSIAQTLPLPNPSVLPAFVDNVIPSLLVHFRILNMQDAKEDTLRDWDALVVKSVAKEKTNTTPSNSDNDVQSKSKATKTVEAGPTLTQAEAYRIRAASVDACHAIVERAHAISQQQKRPWLANVTEALIDGFLWTQAKRPDLRSVPRLVETKTFMY